MQNFSRIILWGGISASVFGAMDITTALPNAQISPSTSPYHQLKQTRSCVGCNLSNSDLQGLDLSGANLEGANLSNANLTRSNLSQS